MGLAGLSFIPGGAAVKGARAMPPARLPEIPQPRSASMQAAAPAVQSTSRGPILDQLAGQPELLGGGLGGALGATQGETPEERARNALLGAAGGAIGGRLARGAAIDQTRMGSNLGNIPKPVQKAQAQGYEGADIGEAQEWVSARSKGLDMSQTARLDRAKAMGFDTRYKLFHATDSDFNQFDVEKIRSDLNLGEDAIFLTDSPAVADSYLGGAYVQRDAPKIIEKNVQGVDIGGGVGRYYSKNSAVYPLYAKNLNEYEVWDMGGGSYDPVFMQRAIKEAKENGAPGIILQRVRDPGIMDTVGPQGNPRTPATVVAVFNPKDVRSVNAAFDPASKESANILATPPEVGGAFVGGALGATQGETPEERARNALLGAAGGAVGGRMARGMTPDKTRMGSNLGNVPQPVQKAQAAGYKGQDIGEAKEWVAARSKGLDMSQAARLDRAKAMGFDTERVLYHGGPKGISAFDLSKIGSNFGYDKKGFFFTNDPSTNLGGAGDYAGRFDDGNVYSVYVRQTNPYTLEQYAEDLNTTVDKLVLYAGDPQPVISVFDDNRDEIIRFAEQRNADGIKFKYTDNSGTDDILSVVFNPSNIRSTNAAFDPSSKQSANILAGVGAVGAGAAMTGAIRPPEQKKPPGQRPRG
jgi:hypothetical protein